MFEKLMNNYYFGKSGKGDFTPDDLPTTRMQLFWEVLRIRFSALIRLNLMQLVVWLPLMLVLMFSVTTAMETIQYIDDGTGVVQFVTKDAEGQEVIEDREALSAEDILLTLKSLLQITLLLMIPCITITGPVTAGASYVVRNWARDEHAFIWADFKDAVKANWKQSLLISFLTSLIPFVVYMCWTFYGDLAATQPIMFVPQVLTVMLAMIWTLAVTYMHPMAITYELKMSGIFRNSLLLAVARLPMSVGIRLLHALPVALAVVIGVMFNVPQYAIMVLFLYYLLIGFSLSRFITASYTNGVFDKYINSRIEGAVVNRGLRTTDDDDDDDDEEEEAAEQAANDEDDEDDDE